MNNLDNIIGNLKASPLFYLFLSSRELFHSNFWFWLSTLNKHEAFKLFTNREIPDDIVFKREHNQSFGDVKSKVDLLLSSGNHPLVAIENKVKDFPTRDQLQRIKSSFNDSNIEFVLATLFWSDDISFEDWDVKTYRHISDAIEPSAFTLNPYFTSLIHDYKSLTLNLSELASALQVNRSYDFAISWNKELYHQLNGIKLWEGYQKLRASHLLHHFAPRQTGVSTAYSINNQKATIDFVVALERGYTIGIQVENVQFRRFVSGRNADLFADRLISKEVFFTRGFPGRGGKPYLNYGKVFKYQYKELKGAASYDELFERVNTELESIQNDIDSILSNLPDS